MSPTMIGIALGLFAGIIQFVALQKVAKSISSRPPSGRDGRLASLMSAVAWIDLAVFPALGGLAGFMLTDGGTAP